MEEAAALFLVELPYFHQGKLFDKLIAESNAKDYRPRDTLFGDCLFFAFLFRD